MHIQDDDLLEMLDQIRDVSDLCEKWPEIKTKIHRDDIQELKTTPEVKALFYWLYTLADKVCPGKNYLTSETQQRD